MENFSRDSSPIFRLHRKESAKLTSSRTDDPYAASKGKTTASGFHLSLIGHDSCFKTIVVSHCKLRTPKKVHLLRNNRSQIALHV
mmetsp:Transcript_3580/g.5124  ORF Transcript_3580/g.5124 Transcript_3580/m.5124 type:complete len:85 (-) Transcript_3580:99-353(-)